MSTDDKLNVADNYSKTPIPPSPHHLHPQNWRVQVYLQEWLAGDLP